MGMIEKMEFKMAEKQEFKAVGIELSGSYSELHKIGPFSDHTEVVNQKGDEAPTDVYYPSEVSLPLIYSS